MAVICLAAGFSAGLQAAREDTGVTGAGLEAEVSLAAGPLTKTGQLHGDNGFSLRLFNPTARRVSARVVSLEGWSLPPRNAREVVIAPGLWATTSFTAAASCSEPPDTTHEVVVEVTGPRGPRLHTVRLPAPATALRNHHANECQRGVMPNPDLLEGVWLVEDPPLESAWTANRYLMRFDRDGTYTADSEGLLFDVAPAVQGTYRVDGGLLTVMVTGGSSCPVGGTMTWRVILLPEGWLYLAYLRGRGDCITPGEVWTARRVLEHAGLPVPSWTERR